MAATDVEFDGTDFNDGVVYITSEIDDSAPWERAVSEFNLAHHPGIVVTDDQYLTKKIIHTGKIHGTGLADLESKIDTFMRQTSKLGRNLDIGYAGGTRRYVVNAKVVSTPRPVRAASWANFTIEYSALEYATATAATTLHSGNITTTTALTINVDGSAPEQYLRVQITLTTVTPSTRNTIYITNPDTGQTMSITRAWLQTDVLIIDSLDQSVKVNSVDVDYDGPFPIYEPENAQTLLIDADFSVSTHVDTITANGNWTAPTGKYSAYVEAWGGGGGGGHMTISGNYGPGGAGGAYSAATVAVVPGNNYAVVIGAAGAGQVNTPQNNTAGGDTSFNATDVLAKGGGRGSYGTGGGAGTGGQASSGLGDIKFSGGNGGAGAGPAGPKSGGGGESASAAGNGTAGTNGSSGGAGGTGTAGGDGGNGVSATPSAGNNGSIPGGGGSGRAGSTTLASGNGARGEVKVSYPVPAFTFAVVVDQIKKYL